MDHPLVSVVIPTHDRRARVREAVASVLSQTMSDFELIVVDDGSTDGTAAALQSEFGDRLRVIETANRGPAAARNRGVAVAGGAWIAFLDSDDTWLPSKLERQLDHLAARPGAKICHTEEIWIRHGVRVNPRAHHAPPDGDAFLPSLERCLVSPSALVLRRDLFEGIGGFDESLPVCEDYDLWLRLACSTPFELVREALVIRHEGHADQLSHRFWGMDRFRVASLRKLLTRPLALAQRDAAIAVLRRKCGILAAGAAKRGRDEEAADYRALAEAYD